MGNKKRCTFLHDMIVIIGADIGLAIDTKVAKLLFLNHSQMYHAHARKI